MLKKGISLVALVITIIVLIILTGVVILNLTNENNVISKASEAVELNNLSIIREKVIMRNMEDMLEGKSAYKDETKTVLEEAAAQSKIDIDKLFVYNDLKDGKQYVFYRLDKVTKEEVKWFMENEVDLKDINLGTNYQGNSGKIKITYLLGDINFDEKIDEEDKDMLLSLCNGEDGNSATYNDGSMKFIIANVEKDKCLDTSDLSYLTSIVNGDYSASDLRRLLLDTYKDESEEELKEYFQID